MVFEINKTEGIIPKYLVTTSTDLIPRDIILHREEGLGCQCAWQEHGTEFYPARC